MLLRLGKNWERTPVALLPVKSHRVNGRYVFVRSHNPKVVAFNPTPAIICFSRVWLEMSGPRFWRSAARPVLIVQMVMAASNERPKPAMVAAIPEICFYARRLRRNSAARDSCLGFLPLISLRPLRSYFKTCLRLDQRKHWRIDAHLSRLQSLRTIGRALEHPWNKTLSLRGDFQQLPGRKAIESSGVMERAMGIEPTSETWAAGFSICNISKVLTKILVRKVYFVGHQWRADLSF